MKFKPYYKLVPFLEPVGTLINTEDRFDTCRIARFSELKYLMSLFFEVSLTNDISICYILTQVYPELFCSEIGVTKLVNLTNDIEKIRNEIDRTEFHLQNEFRFFNDFVLDSVRSELINEGFSLPDRFRSHYFFDSLEQCFNYHSNLPPLFPCKIIEVELVNINQIVRLDNIFLSQFEESLTSNDFYKQAKRCLSGETTERPIFEIVYQGTYQIKSHIIDM